MLKSICGKEFRSDGADWLQHLPGCHQCAAKWITESVGEMNRLKLQFDEYKKLAAEQVLIDAKRIGELILQKRESDRLNDSLKKILKRFADLDCCTGFLLGEKEHPALWDALDEAREALGYGPEKQPTEKRKPVIHKHPCGCETLAERCPLHTR